MSEGNRGPEIPSFMFDKTKREPKELVQLPKQFDFVIEDKKPQIITEEKSESKGVIKFAGAKKKLADGSFVKTDLV